MIAAIARALGGMALDGHGEREASSGSGVCVVEAGTGTGKTVAYLLAVLPIARALGKKVVISTATVALQEQIVFKDLPDLKRSTSLKFEYGLAKGRGRYLCLSKLDRLLNATPTGDIALFPMQETNAELSMHERALYQDMMDKLASQKWAGDRDDWPEELDSNAWSHVTTDHRQCTGRRCEFVRQCAFFKARDSLDELDCVVANHDLVLADLALGGGAILPPPRETIYVFDEGHHLPEKALNHFSAHTRVVSTSRWLGMSEGQWPALIDTMVDAGYFKKLAEPLEALLKQARTQLDALQPLLMPYVDQIDRDAQAMRYRFPNGVVPEVLEHVAQELVTIFKPLADTLEKLSRETESLLDDHDSPLPKSDLDAMYSTLGAWHARAESNVKLWQSYTDTQNESTPNARWLTLYDYDGVVDFDIVSSPILASDTLQTHLWQDCCGAVVTSASLTALGKFDRFKQRSGVPDDASFDVVPSPFDFENNAALYIPEFAEEGNQVSAHTDAIIDHLPDVLADEPAALVLFASRKQMQAVHDALPYDVRDLILLQGGQSKQALIQTHKARVDEGLKSIVFGLASFAEGLDLPGNYCTHVVIAKIPFAVPDDPVEAAMAEWIEAQGGNPFMQIAVPDAAVKLLQACGRLLRTEQDKGAITIFDKRLLSKRYGKAILASLPPFRRAF